MKKIRGFEKISCSQWEQDSKELISRQVDKIWVYRLIQLPRRATKTSSGYDVFSPISFILNRGDDITIPLGFKAYMLPDEFLGFFPRSGIGLKYYTRLANTVGIIDSDYYNNQKNEGHCWLKIRNEGSKELVVNARTAIAQAIFQKFLLADGDSLHSGDDRIGGIGSTDK